MEKENGIISLEENIKRKEEVIKEINVRILNLENAFKEDDIRRINLKEDFRTKDSVANEIIEIIRNLENEFNKRAILNAKLESEQEALYNKLNSELNLTLAEAK